MTIEEKAKELIKEYPNWITPGQLQRACEKDGLNYHEVFKKMMELTK